MRFMAGFLSSLAPVVLVAAGAAAESQLQGHLVLIGGGDKPDDAMAKFIELAGGPQARMVAIATASEDSDVCYYYIDLFRETYGCPNVVTLDIKNRFDAARPDFVELAAAAGPAWIHASRWAERKSSQRISATATRAAHVQRIGHRGKSNLATNL